MPIELSWRELAVRKVRPKKDIEKVLEVYKNNKKANINEPNIEIYNLENYLLDLEKSSLSAIKKSSFFPPYKSYKTISS